MTPEALARESIDRKLAQAGWVVQDMKALNLGAATGVAVREHPTDTGPADYVLFVHRQPVGVIEAKKDSAGKTSPSPKARPSATPAPTSNGAKTTRRCAFCSMPPATPSDDGRKFTELYNVQRLASPNIDPHAQMCISTIQCMYSILSGEPIDESAEDLSLNEVQQTASQAKLVRYNPAVPVETFDFIVIDECHSSIAARSPSTSSKSCTNSWPNHR